MSSHRERLRGGTIVAEGRRKFLATCVHYLCSSTYSSCSFDSFARTKEHSKVVNAIKIVSIVKLAHVRSLLFLSRDQASTIVSYPRNDLRYFLET